MQSYFIAFMVGVIAVGIFRPYILAASALFGAAVALSIFYPEVAQELAQSVMAKIPPLQMPTLPEFRLVAAVFTGIFFSCVFIALYFWFKIEETKNDELEELLNEQ
jgi:hypothetical protein